MEIVIRDSALRDKRLILHTVRGGLIPQTTLLNEQQTGTISERHSKRQYDDGKDGEIQNALT